MDALRVLQRGPGLLGDGLFAKWEKVKNLGGIAGIGASEHGEGVGAHRSNGQHVSTDAAGATGVAGIEHQDTGNRRVVFAVVGQIGGI